MHSGQRQVATIFTQVDQYHVVLEIDPSSKLDADSLNRLYVPSSTGQSVLLSTVARFEDSTSPQQIMHQGLFPAVTLSFNLAPGIALGERDRPG